MAISFRPGTLTLHLFSTCLGTVMLALSACSSDTEVASRKAAEAIALFEGGNLYGARQSAMASVQARDDVSASWITLGRIQLASGLVGDAYVSYTRALELDATNIEAMQHVAEIALQVGRFREADKAADQVLALQPGLTRPKLIKGFVALNNGKLDIANTMADEILKADPTEDGGVVLKARTLAKQGNFVESVERLKNQQIVSKSEIVVATLAEVQRSARNGPGLADALTLLVAQRPTDDRVFDLAGVLYKIGKPQAARAAIFKRLEARKDSAEHHAEVTAFLISADPGAIDQARIARISTTGTPQMRKLAARVLLAGNRAAEARRVLEPLYPVTSDPDIRALYATVLAATGDGSGASAIVASVLDADETNVDALLLRARTRLESGDEKGAMADAALIARDSPLSIGGRMVTIDAYLRRGNKRRARQLFEEGVRLMPKNLEMTQRYVGFLQAERDYIRAEEIVSDYTGLNPSRVAGWDLLRSLCRDEMCRERAATGRSLAMTLFPADEFTGRKAPPGLFGPL